MVRRKLIETHEPSTFEPYCSQIITSRERQTDRRVSVGGPGDPEPEEAISFRSAAESSTKDEQSETEKLLAQPEQAHYASGIGDESSVSQTILPLLQPNSTMHTGTGWYFSLHLMNTAISSHLK